MADEVTILHLSDLHAKIADKDKLKSRIDALLDDLLRQNLTIDFALFTGDLAFAGKTEEYELANELLFEMLARRFQLGRKRIFIIPGNHDVDRALVDQMEEAGLKKSLKTSEDAAKAFKANGYASKRLNGYFEFIRRQTSTAPGPFSFHKISARGVEIGIACLNSAWRCSSEKDKGKLFLTHEQVNVAANALEKCALRIALIHHPFEWYHPAEADILEDLKRSFEVILSGHLHAQASVAEQTTAHNSLHFTVPALFEGIYGSGYNVYRINIENRLFTADFRKFIGKRNEFDRDTNHARDGRHQFNLPVRDISKLTRALMVQRIDACKTKLQETVKQQLQVIQKVNNPVLVTPKIAKTWWNNGSRMRSPMKGTLADIAKNNSVIYGPGDSGKTILLQTLAADLNEARITLDMARFALYVDFGTHDCAGTKESLCAFLDSVFEKEFPGESLRHAIILADNINEKAMPVFDFLLELSKERDLIVVVAVGSDLLFEALGKKSSFEKCDFYQLSHWGPSRIREFVSKYFEGTAIDVDAAYNFVHASLEDTDLPATPWVVSLYLSIFPTLGKQVSSLSFLRLLEKIEEHRLGQVETSSADSLYNKREILMRLACLCLKGGKIVVDRETFDETITTFFKDKMLPVDLPKFIESLNDSGLVHVSPDSVKFTYYAFYDYFLARAFERHISDIDSMLTDLSACLSIGHALSLYSGIFRDNSRIAKTVLSFVGTAFKNSKEFTIKDLEKHINDLLLGNDQKRTPDQIVEADLKTKVQYEAYDDAFEKRKSQQAQHRAAGIGPIQSGSEVQQIETALRALKTFYNLFRNLENISGHEKVKLLDQVLDFHINCGFNLIQFFNSLAGKKATSDFKTLTAYLVTMGSQVFLASNIGNQSLEQAIVAALETCKNDLKQLILVNLYSDLRLPGYQKRLEDYVRATDSLAAAEIIYMQTRYLLVTHDSLHVPASLIAAFHAAFRKRHELLGDKTTKGAFDRAYSDDVEDAKRQHLSFFNAKEELLRGNYYS